jgi:hypothetical protein
MKRWVVTAIFGLTLLAFSFTTTRGHDVITTRITWNREISRLFNERCMSCHHQNGSAFPLTTYAESRPWAVAIKEEVLARRMPPWGGVKGFGEFRNDQALTAEQLEMITDWVEGGVPEGSEKDVPPAPKPPEPWSPEQPADGLTISGDFTVSRPIVLDGIWPKDVPENASIQLMAELPDGRVEPLVWLYQYKKQYAHPFLFRTPLELPKGTVITGVAAGASFLLLPLNGAPE